MTLKSDWTSESIPDLNGKTILITGASSGIGLEATRALLDKNATVVLACRNRIRFEQAIKTLRNKKRAYFVAPLDLSNLISIENFANEFKKSFRQLHVLINNAGVMNTPFERTLLGVNIQFGVNHLGHYALCGHLLNNLLQTSGSRIVNVSSIAAAESQFDLANIYSAEKYEKNAAYRLSKLANLYFSLELNERFIQNKLPCISVSAHPGYAKSNLQRHSKGLLRKLHILYTIARYGQSAKAGALSILRAATETSLNGGEYFYPGSANGLKGVPVAGVYPPIALNDEYRKMLWVLSEELTTIKYHFNS